jgi:hypothetical protein
MKKIISKIKTMIKGEEIMKRFFSFWGFTGLLLALIVLKMGPVASANDYPKDAVKIPNTFILPNGKFQPVTDFIGYPATPNPIEAAEIPQNPSMGANPWTCIHNDSYMSDTYPVLEEGMPFGPLGNYPEVFSTWLGTPANPVGIAVTIVFDKKGLLVTAPVKMVRAIARAWVQLTLIDPKDLSTLAVLKLPEEIISGPGFRPAGSYFFIDKDDRIFIGTKDRTIWVVSHSEDQGKWSFTHTDTWDLSGAIPEGDSIEALQPDWAGRLWFTSKGGVVGTLDMSTGGVLDSINLSGERIVNGHASDETGGVFIASTLAMYRFDFAEGKIVQTWRKTYDAGTHVKEGQTDIGTGTTPTLMGDQYVTITDNGQPSMHVLVYKRLDGTLVCAEPVFQPGQASNENSLIATDKSIIVENNFGYKDPQKDTTHGRTTKPGIARIDMNDDGNGCHTVWTNESVSIPSVVSKMSLANGLIYTYTKPKGPGTTDPWYFTAIDFWTGEVVFEKLAGYGIFYNNHYAGAYIGPDGTLFVGVLGGIVAMRDGE